MGMLCRRGLLVACSFTSSTARVLPRSCITIGSALRAAEHIFVQNNVPEASLSAQYLLARAAGFGNSRADLQLQRSQLLNESARLLFEKMCEQRLLRVPVQYILGDWDFHELTLIMEAPVLIPRPETEYLVELVLQAHRDYHACSKQALRILDVGCGCGAIGLALIKQLPHAHCTGIDIRHEAAELSVRNADLTGLSDRYHAELIEAGITAYLPEEGKLYDIIVANPPYIPSADMATLAPEVVDYEDERALCGGLDGMDVIRQVLLAASSLLRRGGPCTLWLEVDPSQPPLIERFVERNCPDLEFVRTYDDQFGLQRFCRLHLRNAGCADK